MKISEDLYYIFPAVLNMIYCFKLLHLYGKADKFLEEHIDCQIHYDYEFDIMFDSLFFAVEFFSYQCSESSEISELFFADEIMTEYYTLCGEYGKIKNLSKVKNPYIQKADQYITDCMMIIKGGGYEWKLAIGTKHKYASALHFYRYYDFEENPSLLEAVLDIFNFYHNEIEVLRNDLVLLKNPLCKSIENSNESELKAA